MAILQGNGLAHRLCVLVFMAVFLAACSDSTSTDVEPQAVALVTLLPAASRGFLHVRTGGEATLPEQLLPDTRSAAAWRHTPADLLAFYASGLDLSGDTSEWLFAQTTQAGDEYALLVNLDPRVMGSTHHGIETTPAAPYRDIAIENIAANGLSIANLAGSTWAIAARPALESVIDVYRGTSAGLEASLLADYLPEPGTAPPLFFVYGLPALYMPTTAPGSGQASLNAATAVRGTLTDTAAALQVEIFSPTAATFAERFNALLPETAQQPLLVQGNRLGTTIEGPDYRAQALSLAKSLFPVMNAVDYAQAVNDPGNPPWLNFDVGENPNSIFINFEFASEQARAAFAAQHLPRGFTLAPLRILDSEEPRYFLVLNVYQSSGGLVEGARAEWSVFVHDPETAVPRFLVIQAAAETFSADSVNGFTQPEPVSHLLDAQSISSYVGVVNEETATEELYFASSLKWPQDPEDQVRFSREFVVANDFIFWGNAVADRGLYNSSVHNRAAVRIAGNDIQIDDRSRWAAFVHPEPVHTLVYRNRLEIVISPWWNLAAPYLDVTAEYRQELLDFKNAFYPGTVIGNAEAAMRGERPALTPFVQGEDVPSTYYHFEIQDVAGLLNSINSGAAVQLEQPIALAVHEGEQPAYYLTLALTQRSGDPCALQAHWNIYLLNEQGNPQTVQLDALGSEACVDPVSLVGLNAAIAHEATNGQIHTRIRTPLLRIDMTTDLRMAEAVLAGAQWIEAGDQLCALNGICDLMFYDGKTLSDPVLRVGASAVTVAALQTPWDAYIAAVPSQVTVRDGPALMATNRWINVPVFGADQ